MHEEIVFAGFGGQGVLFAAQVLVYAGLMGGKQVAWVPSYGPEMRGGTASATVIISDEEIGSLVVAQPTVAAIMNTPSFEKFEPMVRSGGILAVNRSLVDRPCARADIRLVEVRANDLATELGNPNLANMVMLGAVASASRAVSPDLIVAALGKTLTGRKAELLREDEAALRRGLQSGKVARG